MIWPRVPPLHVPTVIPPPSHPLVGKWALASGAAKWRIAADVGHGYFLVQGYTAKGAITRTKVVHLQTMTNWDLFDTDPLTTQESSHG